MSEIQQVIGDRGKKIVFIWVPAHIGVRGNEVADWLAKQGTKAVVRAEFKIPADDFRRCYEREGAVRTRSKIKTEARDKGKFYFENFYEDGAQYPWFKEIRSNRFVISTINRLRANHYNLGESLVRKNYIYDARCECGAEVETLGHVIWQCERYDEQRIEFRRRLEKYEGAQSYCVWS